MADTAAHRFPRLREVLSDHVEHGGVPSITAAVHHRGETHVVAVGGHEPGGAGRPVEPDTLFRLASLTKPVTAVVALTLVEECRLRLDDPVDALLPELADRRVLARPGAELDDTVPALRPITLRDLLTCRNGLGAVMLPPGSTPLQRAVDETGLGPGPDTPGMTPDEYLKRMGALPLAAQPGEEFLYHTGFDILAALLGRATDRSFPELVRERVLDPLGMHDTGFHVPEAELGRLTPHYTSGRTDGTPAVSDPGGAESRYAKPPSFATGGSGLVSTAEDYLTFLRMLLDGGRTPDGRGRILSRGAVAAMTTDQMTDRQRLASPLLGESAGWGFGLGITLRRTDPHLAPGRFGWSGGTGTTAAVDPAEGLIGVLMTNRMMASSANPPVFVDFWTTVYRSLDD